MAEIQNLFLDSLPTNIPFIIQCLATDGSATNPSVDNLVIYEEGGADTTFDSTTITGSPFDPVQINSKTGLWGVMVPKSSLTAGKYYILLWEVSVDSVTTAKVELYFAVNTSSFKADVANLDVTVSSRLADVDYTAVDVSGISAVTDKIDTALELDGAVYRFTTNALELAPVGGGTVNANVISVGGTAVTGTSDFKADVSGIDAVVVKLDTALELDVDVYRFTANALEQAPLGGGSTNVNIVSVNDVAVTSIDDFKADVANLDVAVSSRLADVDYTAVDVSGIVAVTDKLDTAIELDGAVYRFTTNALEQSPAGGSTDVNVITVNGVSVTNIDDFKADLTTIESRLTSARAGYLDKLNVTGDLAHSDNADLFKSDIQFLDTDVSGILTVPNHYLYQLGRGNIDFDNDTFKLVLCDPFISPNRDNHATYLNISAFELSTLFGYTATGHTLTPSSTLIEDDAADRSTISFDPLTITATGGNIGPFQYIIVYDDTTDDDTIVAIWKLDTEVEVVDGTNYVVSGIKVEGRTY